MMSERSESDSEPDGEFEGSEKPSLDEQEESCLADESRPSRRIRQRNVHVGIHDRYVSRGSLCLEESHSLTLTCLAKERP